MIKPTCIRNAAFVVLAAIWACSPQKDPAVEMILIGDSKVPLIHVEEIKEKAVVKLSDWVGDLRLIQLETNKQCMLDHVMRVYVGKEYILISTVDKGIMMFDGNGKFIRILASHGKGPGEVMDPNRNIFVDEKNDRLYVTDFTGMRDRIISYDIKTGNSRTIPIMHKGSEIGIRDVIVQNDSMMYITTMQVRGGKSNCPLFCQTTSGRLLWEIKKTHPRGLTDATLQMVDNRIYMYYIFAQDTTWMVENQQLNPVSIITSEKPNAYFEEKEGSLLIGLSPLKGSLFLGRLTSVKSVAFDKQYGMNRATYNDRVMFVFDAESNHATSIGQVQNDYLGSNEKFYLQFHYNGLATVSYQAFELRQIADSVSKRPDISKEVKGRMKFILDNVGESDNPVLMVGKIKDL